MAVYDAIVLGTGGVGSAALYHLARRGLRVLGIDRFPPGHDRGSSHGRTRIIRQAYFEHPDYVPMLLRAYRRWEELAGQCGQQLYHETGLLQVGPPEGAVVQGVLASAKEHGLAIEELPGAEVEARWPGFRVPRPLVGLFEPRAGYLQVEACVIAHSQQAVQQGAELCSGETILRWQADGRQLVVTTDRQQYRAARLIITAGPWAAALLADLKIPLVVRRKSVIWLARPDAASVRIASSPQGVRGIEESYRADAGYPAYLFELPQGVFYGFPQIDELGVKVAEHSGGAPVGDPLSAEGSLDPADLQRVLAFTASHLPLLSQRVTAHSICFYTMSPDEHFLVDRHPEHPHVTFAAGLSGHGFKFACVLGEAMADLAVDGDTEIPIGFLSIHRPSLRR
jgi:sarcosine oxidase